MRLYIDTILKNITLYMMIILILSSMYENSMVNSLVEDSNHEINVDNHVIADHLKNQEPEMESTDIKADEIKLDIEKSFEQNLVDNDVIDNFKNQEPPMEPTDIKVDEIKLDIEKTFEENLQDALKESGEVFEENTWFMEEIHSHSQLDEFVRPTFHDSEQIGGGVLALFDEIDFESSLWKDFRSVADKYSRMGLRFAYTVNSELRSMYKLKFHWGIVIFYPPSLITAGKTNSIFSEKSFQVNSVMDFINKNALPPVSRITYDNEEFFLHLNKTVIMCYVDCAHGTSLMESVQKEMKHPAMRYRSSYIFAIVEIAADEDYLRYFSSELMFSLEERQKKGSVLLGARSLSGEYYKLSDSKVTKSTINSFVDDLYYDKLTSFPIHGQQQQQRHEDVSKDEL